MRSLLRTVSAVSLVCLSAGANGATVSEMEQRTRAIATRYLQVWSSNDLAAVENVPYIYGRQVTFYGRPYSQSQLIAEKRRAIQQWPVRQYSHRLGSMRIYCNAHGQKCGARSIIDFEVRNPARGLAKRGSARFDLGVSFEGSKPLILWEGGSLGKRRD